MFQVATGAIHAAIVVYELVRQASENAKEVEPLGNRLKQLSTLLINAEKNKALLKNQDLKTMLDSCDKVGQDSSTYLNGFTKKSKVSRLFGAQTHKVNFDNLNKDLDRCIAYFTASLTADSNKTLNNIVENEELKQQMLIKQQREQRQIAVSNLKNQQALADLQVTTITQQQLAAAQLLAQQQEILSQLAALKMQQTTTVASSSSTTVTTTVSMEGLSHKQRITASCMLSNGLVASGSEDRTIKLWDQNKGYTIDTLRINTGTVNGILELYRNGKPTGYAASVSSDEKVNVWSIAIPTLETPRDVKTFRGHQAPVNCIADFENGKIATGSSDMTIRIWDIDAEDVEEAQIIKIKGHTKQITALVAMSSDLLVSTSHDQTVNVWSIDWKNNSSELLYTLEEQGFIERACKVSDNIFATANIDGIIKLWNLKSGAEIASFTSSDAGLYSLTSMGPGSNIIVYGEYSGRIVALDVTDNKFKKINEMTRSYDKTVFTLAAGSSSDLVISGGKDKKLKLINIRTGAEVLTFTGTKTEVLAKIGNGQSSNTATLHSFLTSAPVATQPKTTSNRISPPPSSNVSESGSPESQGKLTYVPL